jgi:hypothetical protein
MIGVRAMLGTGLISIVNLAPLAPRLPLKSMDKVSFLLFFVELELAKDIDLNNFQDVLTFFINLLKIGMEQPVYAQQQPVYAPQEGEMVFVQPEAYSPQLQIVEYAKPEPVHEAEPEHELGNYQQAEEEPESAKMNDPNMPQTYDF